MAISKVLHRHPGHQQVLDIVTAQVFLLVVAVHMDEMGDHKLAQDPTICLAPDLVVL